MRSFPLIIFLSTLWKCCMGGSLNSSLVTEGKCDANYIQPDNNGNPLYAVQQIQTNWYVAMISEYGQRLYAEYFLGRPAKDQNELMQMNPRLMMPYINATDVDGNVILTGYDRRIKAQCAPTSLSMMFNCECRDSRNVKKNGNGKEEDEDDDDDEDDPKSLEVPCSKVGSFSVSIFKIDEQKGFILFALCPKSKKRYWFALTRKAVLPEKTIRAIKKAVGATGKFSKDKAITIVFDE